MFSPNVGYGRIQLNITKKSHYKLYKLYRLLQAFTGLINKIHLVFIARWILCKANKEASSLIKIQ
ncbi:hypothetical protein CGSMWGv00703Bmash_05567 [Gardnerella pickettii 00703Bmash]|nr:hypothetical protein CGSMWGv00703Bmash_05567 [Gardnerella pickettii 00703Bmash]